MGVSDQRSTSPSGWFPPAVSWCQRSCCAALLWWPSWLQFVFPLRERLVKAQIAVRAVGKGREGASHAFHSGMNYRQPFLILQLVFTQECQLSQLHLPVQKLLVNLNVKFSEAISWKGQHHCLREMIITLGFDAIPRDINLLIIRERTEDSGARKPCTYLNYLNKARAWVQSSA